MTRQRVLSARLTFRVASRPRLGPIDGKQASTETARMLISGTLAVDPLLLLLVALALEAVFGEARGPLARLPHPVRLIGSLIDLCDRLQASLTATATTRRRLLDALLHEALTPARQKAA